MTRICTIVGAKGGTTKTGSISAIAAVLVDVGMDVVMVDADPQGSLTRRTNFERVPEPLRAEPVTVPGFSGPGSLRLLRSGRQLEGVDEVGIRAHFARAAALKADIILIDTPPSLGPIVRSAMRAAHLILVPCTPGAEAIDGLRDTIATAADLAPTIRIRGYLTLVHRQSKMLRWSSGKIDTYFPGFRYPFSVPFEMAAAESGTLRLPVTISTPGSHSAFAYRNLSREILTDLGLPQSQQVRHA